MLIDDIKNRVRAAMKSGNTVEKEILRVALGEIQTEEARGTKQVDDTVAAGIVRKLVKSNRETLEVTTDEAKKATLAEEISILESLLPRSLTPDQIVAALAPVADTVRGAGNDGQATGVAMKFLKGQGAVVDGKDVAQAIKKLRS